MNKIEFKDLPDTTTPLSASNLNTLQDNIEEAINTNDIYSTNEIVIGKWVDNRPTYRKAIYISSFPNNATMDYAAGINNLDFAFKVYGYLANSSGSNLIVNGDRPDQADSGVGAWTSNNYIRIATKSDRSGYSGYIILEYTKTTD